MTDFKASPLQHQVEGYENVIGSFDGRRDQAMKLIARGYDLNLRLTREFRYRPAGILRRHVELAVLCNGRRASTYRYNGYCSIAPRTVAPTFQASSCCIAP